MAVGVTYSSGLGSRYKNSDRSLCYLSNPSAAFCFFRYISPSLSVLVSLPFLDNMSHLQQFRIPDLHADVPLKDSTNPHYRAAAAESRAWINSFHIFKNRKRVDFIQGLNELLCSHVYCFAGYEQFRTTCDFVSLGAS